MIKIAGVVFGISAFFLLLILFYLLLKFSITYYYDLDKILYAIKNKWDINPTSGIGFASLLLGFLLILFSVISLILIYTYDFVFSLFKSKFESVIKPTNKVKNFNKKYLDKRGKKELAINLVPVKKDYESFKKNQSTLNLENKKDKPESNDVSEIPLPKSITNSDAYSVIQKMQNNNQDPLVSESNEEYISVGEKKENLNLKHDELRRRILKKFNTSLNDVKNKNS